VTDEPNTKPIELPEWVDPAYPFLAAPGFEPMPPPEADALPILDPRGGTTSPIGLPFPASNEPVSQGAAAIQSLAQALDLKMQAQWQMQNVAIASGPTEGYIPFTESWLNDFGTFAAGSGHLVFPRAGRVIIVGQLNFSGATGSGETRGRIMRYNAAGTAVYQPAAQWGALDSPVSMAGFDSVAAGEFLVLFHLSTATGTGHSVSGYLAAAYLG
jgi:hypothetical protein